MRPRRNFGSNLPTIRSAAVRLALALVAGSLVYALFHKSYGGALLLAPADVVGRLWLWQPLTYAFVETSPISVVFGALVLWQAGGALEQSWGSRRLVTFAIGTTVLAGFLTVALSFLIGALELVNYGGGWVMSLAVWVAFGLSLGKVGTNFWGIPVSGNVLALIGAGFLFFEGAFYGWLLVVPAALAVLLTAGYVRVGGPGMWWLRLQSWRLQRRLRGRSKHLKVVAPDRNTPGSSDRYLH
jgi:membrane associated rhomboid family serine protease